MLRRLEAVGGEGSGQGWVLVHRELGRLLRWGRALVPAFHAGAVEALPISVVGSSGHHSPARSRLIVV